MVCKKCNFDDTMIVNEKPAKLTWVRRLILLTGFTFLFVSNGNNVISIIGAIHIPLYIGFRIFDSARVNGKNTKCICKKCGHVWFIG